MSPRNNLPAIATPALLAALRGNAQLPSHSWYVVASVTLSAIGRPEEVPEIFKFAIEHGEGPADNSTPTAHAERLQIARKLREGLIKSSPIVGMPKTINSLFALKEATPTELLDVPAAAPSSRPAEVYDTPTAEILQRGQTYFEQVYGKMSAPVMDHLDQSGTEDLGVLTRLTYGYVLSNESILTAAESSFVLLAGLIPQDVNLQLKGHLRGALNSGATVEEVRAVRQGDSHL